MITSVLLAFRVSKRAHDYFDAAVLQAIGIGIACSWLQGLVGWGHRSSFIHLPYFAVLAGTIAAYNYLEKNKARDYYNEYSCE